MIRTKRRVALCLGLLALNLAFIWGNSLLPGEASGAFSKWVRDILAALFPGGEDKPDAGHGLLRKLAHFTEFCTLGLCLSWLFSMLEKRFWLPILCGFLVACTDEFIQCFIPDRGPALRDVCIDTAGVVLGVALLLGGYAIYQNQKNKKKSKENLL